ncbi:MAG TPA: heme-binding protein, partial [Gemmataceae bacterium]|nr:heme-binding protein [Gemmataceae bacterium]
MIAIAGLLCSMPALADDGCSIPDAIVKNLQAQLATVVNQPDANGGLFKPNRMWSAVVDRQGVLCSVIRSDPDAWPGSRSIAIAKASTANDFSNNKLALSTANLYSFTQPANTAPAVNFPAGSLYGLNNSNPFNPEFQAQGTGIGRVPGGIITFGGGVALYRGGQVIGGLGVSGDTACADHAIAFRMRQLAKLDGTPSSDNIVYLGAGELP